MEEEKQCLQRDCERVTVSKSTSGLKKSRMDGPDGGFAWLVALAACLINFIMAGLGRMSGILFVAFIEIFGVDRKNAAMPFSVRSSGRNLFGPVVGILGQKYGPRKVIVAGGIVGTISASACFFTPQMLWITILWGGINGLGTAMTATLPQVVIGQYFVKHRTTAAGMAFSGGCVGSFLFPVLLEYILLNFGIEGTFLLIGAITMHTIPAALILRKPSWLKAGEMVLRAKQCEVSQSLDNLVPTDNDAKNKMGGIKSEKSLNSNKNCLTSETIVHTVDERNNKKSQSKYMINSDIHPNIEFLKQKSELVEKIFSLNHSEKNNLNIIMNDSLKDFNVMDELLHLCRSQSYSGEKSWFQKNIGQTDANFFNEDTKDNLKVVANQQYRSFHLKSPNSEIIRAHSASDLSSKINEESRTFFLNRLSELQKSKIDNVAANFPEEKDDVVLILAELCKIKVPCIEIVKSTPEKELNVLPEEESKPEIHSNSFVEHIKTALKLYTNPLFLMICFCRSCHFITFVPVMTTVVDFSMDKGLREDDGKYVIAAISAGDLVGRLCLGWITDRGFMGLPKYMMTVMVIQGISTACLPMMQTKITIFAGLAVFGMLQGSLFVRHPVLVSKYMRHHEQSIAMGCVNFFSGLLGFALPYYIGFFRDTIGSYDYIFYINGMIGACVGLLWVFEPIFVRIVNSKRTTQKIVSA